MAFRGHSDLQISLTLPIGCQIGLTPTILIQLSQLFCTHLAYTALVITRAFLQGSGSRGGNSELRRESSGGVFIRRIAD